MTVPVNLAAARAQKLNDSTKWTPLDALKWLVAEIEAGRENPASLSIDYYEVASDKSRTHGYVVSNLTRDERIGLLVVAQARAVEDWLK